VLRQLDRFKGSGHQTSKMGGGTAADGRGAWEAAIRKAIEENTRLVDTMEETLQAQDELLGAVADLPKRTQHAVMVPFGPVAFMPGYLVHTNELMVHLGGKTYVERTAAQTVGILARRKQLLEEETAICRIRVETLRKRLDVGSTVMVTEDGLLDIREDYDPAIHEAAPPESAPAVAIGPAKSSRASKAHIPDEHDTELTVGPVNPRPTPV